MIYCLHGAKHLRACRSSTSCRAGAPRDSSSSRPAGPVRNPATGAGGRPSSGGRPRPPANRGAWSTLCGGSLPAKPQADLQGVVYKNCAERCIARRTGARKYAARRPGSVSSACVPRPKSPPVPTARLSSAFSSRSLSRSACRKQGAAQCRTACVSVHSAQPVSPCMRIIDSAPHCRANHYSCSGMLYHCICYGLHLPQRRARGHRLLARAGAPPGRRHPPPRPGRVRAEALQLRSAAAVRWRAHITNTMSITSPQSPE